MLISIDKLKKYNMNINGVFHVGAHKLEEQNIYNYLNIQSVLWFEANPYIVKDIKNKNPEINNLYNLLLSDVDDELVDFYITNNGQSSSILKLKDHSHFYPSIIVSETIKLKTIKMKTFIEKNNINMNDFNFINLDVQGSELKVLKGFEEYIKFIDYIYTEINISELYEGCCLINHIDDFLKKYNFDRVETILTNENWGDALYIKNKEI